MEFAEHLFRTALCQHVGNDRFDLWFEEVRFELQDETLRVKAATPFITDRLRRDFKDELQTTTQAVQLNVTSIDFITDESVRSAPVDSNSTDTVAELENGPSDSTPGHDPADSDAQIPPPEPASVAGRRRTDSVPASSGLLRAASATRRGRRFRSFASFQDGDCNRLAKTSIEMATQRPGELSPLLVHGPTGVGKTHLVEAIWSEMKTKHRRSRVLYLSAEQFTSYFLEALKGSGLPSFRSKYRQADLLIIDDIQFFANKQATLVELAYTVDALSRQHRQLILTADRPLPQLGMALGQDLANRLGGGLVCGMTAVDQKTMEAISRRWAVDRNIKMDDGVHALVCSKMQGDARQLSGILNRLHATSVALEQPITHRMASEVIHELVPSQARVIRLKDIHKAICEVFGLESEVLQQTSRSRASSQPRMLAMWLARKYTTAGLHEISHFFGRRSHSSAVTAHNTVDGWVKKGARLKLSGQECDVRDIISQVETALRAG